MDEPAATASDPSPTPGSSSTGDLLYDAFYGAAIGGSAIALFFLVADSLAGRPLSTPSMLGEALLAGADPGAPAQRPPGKPSAGMPGMIRSAFS